MKSLLFTLILLMSLTFTGIGQNIGLNDNNSAPKASAMLDVYSVNKGLLIPRVALTITTSALPVTTPETSLMVYNSATVSDVTPGYYFWNGTIWVRLIASADQKFVLKTANTTLLKSEHMVVTTGDVTLTLPIVTAADDGLEITVKNIGTYTDLTLVAPQAAKFIDAVTIIPLTRWHGITFIASGTNWIIKEKNEAMTLNALDVGPSESFTSIAQVLAFLNAHMSGSTVVRIGIGSYSEDAQTINLGYPVIFQGHSSGETIIVFNGFEENLFTVYTKCTFERLNFFDLYGSETGFGIVGSQPFEMNNCTFDQFQTGIYLQSNSPVSLSNIVFGPSSYGVRIGASNSNVSFKITSSVFQNWEQAISLESAGASSVVSILNNNFTNNTIGIYYAPSTGSNNFRFASLVIANNVFQPSAGQVFAYGFDFSRSDGRDAEVIMENNTRVSSGAPFVQLNVLNNTTNTTITTAGTYYKAAIGTSFQTSVNCKWDAATDTTNRIRYLPVYNSDGIATISGNISNETAGVRTINIALVKNGNSAILYGVTSVYIVVPNKPFNFTTTVYLPGLKKNDYLELWVTSSTNGELVRIDDLNWFTDTK